ncbi:MAG: hypothetical protein HW396_258 [Candidatus Dadabacteria bacterium]|nr:hypothetical protein [Candidatus Dadabacteria bacterium]
MCGLYASLFNHFVLGFIVTIRNLQFYSFLHSITIMVLI